MTVIGLVGCGNWGKNILRDLLALGCTVHVADPDHERRNLALTMGARSVCPRSENLPECDGFVVAVPINSLAGQVLALLPRGVPIFSEKTLCPSRAEADSLRRAGADGRVFLMHKWEYHNGIRALRALVKRGRIGELEQIRCRREGWVAPGRSPDALTLLAIHDLTIIRHILGEFPEPDYALMAVHDGIPVSLTAVLGKGPRAVMSIDARHPENCRAVTLMGSLGAAHLSGAYADHILVRDRNGEERIDFKTNMPLVDELSEFLAYLEGGPTPRCGFDHAEQAARVLDSLRRCAVEDQGSTAKTNTESEK